MQCIPDVTVHDSIYVNRLTEKWFCLQCVKDSFPFNHFENSWEFEEAIAENFLHHDGVSLQKLLEYEFNVFELNDDHQINPLVDIDPDIQFYNASNCIDSVFKCDYYLEDSFIKKKSSFNFDDTNLSLLHLNIRSIPKNLTGLSEYLSAINFNFSVVGISETWLSESTADCYTLLGYRHEKAYRDKQRGGGVSLFVKNSINYHIRQDLTSVSSIMESIFIEVPRDATTLGKDVLIGVIYRPPGTDVALFNERITQLLSSVQLDNKLLYIMGDFNINLLNCDTHTASSEFIEIMYSHGLFPLINKPTRATTSSTTLIDNIFSNNLINNDIINGIFFTSISDHFPIFTINLNDFTQKDRVYVTRRYSQKQLENFSNSLRMKDWQNVLANHNGKDAFNLFLKNFTDLYNEQFPSKLLKSNYSTRKLWLSAGLKKSIAIKNKLYWKYKRSNSASDLKNYKDYKRNLNRLLKKAERDHFENLLHENKSNTKKLWKIIKGVIGKKKRDNVQTNFKIGSDVINDKQFICKHFNSYFSNIGSELDKKIPASKIDPLQYVSHNDRSIFLNPVDQTEIMRIITELKDCSPGWDGIEAKVVKKTSHLFLDPLQHVLNLSLSQGFFPDDLKRAKVVPIHKSGDSMSFSNYRPISILPLFSKVLEKIMYNRLITFINRHGLLYKFQFGFRSQYSTNQALIFLVDKIVEAIDRGDIVVGVFLDFRKAFDTVNHEILLAKLYRYGIRGTAWQWIKDYLTCRKQYVFYNGTRSDDNVINYGVPQGSILGPLLFLIYINDISKVSKTLLPIIFADDTNVFLSGRDIDQIIRLMNVELTLVVEWLRANRLSLNIDKTNFMIFHAHQKRISPTSTISIERKNILRVNETKFIGVTMDSHLTWASHLNRVKQKVARGLGVLNRARKVFNQPLLVTLYNGLILPHFTYCIEVWGNAAQIHMMSLFKLQKRCMRIIKSTSFKEHTLPIFKDLNILPMSLLYQHRLILFMFKYVKGLLPDIFDHLFTRNNARNTRQRFHFKIKPFKSTLFSKTVRIEGVRQWNNITHKIDHCCSYHTFKKNLKGFLLQTI